MILLADRVDFPVWDERPIEFLPVSYPKALVGLDLRPQIRFTSAPGYRPPIDHAHRLRSYVVGAELMRRKGLDRDFPRVQAEAWGTDRNAAARMVRIYCAGAGSVTEAKRFGLRKCSPIAWEIASMPWDLLVPREEVDLKIGVKVPEASCWTESYVFWNSLHMFRIALRSGCVEPIARSARVMLEAIPLMLEIPLVRSVAIEFVDLVHRLICVLPNSLLEGGVRTDLFLRGILTPGEVKSLEFEQPISSFPNLIVDAKDIDRKDSAGWKGRTPFKRYMYAKLENDAEFLAAARSSWSFIPKVAANYAELDAVEDLREKARLACQMRM